MAEKIVHVDAYMRSDGTYVHEHERHINTQNNYDYSTNETGINLLQGKVDILDMHINKDGDIEAYVLDTYDFNKNSTDKMVQKGYNAQEHNLINNYYTLIKVIKKL